MHLEMRELEYFLRRRLSVDREIAIFEHLEGCPRCYRRVAGLAPSRWRPMLRPNLSIRQAVRTVLERLAPRRSAAMSSSQITETLIKEGFTFTCKVPNTSVCSALNSFLNARQVCRYGESGSFFYWHPGDEEYRPRPQHPDPTKKPEPPEGFEWANRIKGLDQRIKKLEATESLNREVVNASIDNHANRIWDLEKVTKKLKNSLSLQSLPKSAPWPAKWFLVAGLIVALVMIAAGIVFSQSSVALEEIEVLRLESKLLEVERVTLQIALLQSQLRQAAEVKNRTEGEYRELYLELLGSKELDPAEWVFSRANKRLEPAPKPERSTGKE